jgi:HEAT repeat protein
MRDRSGPGVPFLIRLLSDEAKVGSKHFAVPTNIRFPPGDAIPDQDVPIIVADKARDALFQIGEPSVEPCIRAMRTSADVVRGDLMMILRRLKDPRGIEAISGCLDDSNPWIRKKAVEALMAWNDPRVVPPLIRALKDNNDEVRQSAVWVLGSIRGERFVQPLTEALNDKDELVRRGAERALRKQRSSNDSRSGDTIPNSFRNGG